MNLVFTGNLWLANSNASFAISSGMPSNSNKILPASTGATKWESPPAPPPMPSSGLLAVRGLSGKILIQIFPPFSRYLIMVLLAASI